jgi:hypothetical protein
MTYEYSLNNFVSIPTGDNTRIIIQDKNGNFRYSVILDLSHWFVKNNCLVIKITNGNDIMLSFDSRETAQSALDKLEIIRKMLLVQTGELVEEERPTLNTLNIQMMANVTAGYGSLATVTPVLQKPKSRIKVYINGGGMVYAGKPSLDPDGHTFGCYFTSPEANGDDIQARVNDGDVQLGDLLYWTGRSGFDLDVTDRIDLEYFI